MSVVDDSSEGVLSVELSNNGARRSRRRYHTTSNGDRSCETVDRSIHTGPARQPKAPDGGWGWMVAVGSFVGHFFLEGTCRSMGIIYVALLDRYGGSATATALPMSFYNTIRMVLGPLASLVVERFSCRVSLVIGGVLSCAAFFMSAQATRLLHVILAYGVLGGVAASLIFTPMYIIVGEYFDKRRGIAMSIGTVGCGVGAIAIAPLTASLVEEYSLFGTYLILGALMMNCSVAGMLFRPLVPEKAPVVYGEEREDGDVVQATEESDENAANEHRENNADCGGQLQTLHRQSESLSGPDRTRKMSGKSVDESQNRDVERCHGTEGQESRGTNQGRKVMASCTAFFQRFSMLKSLTYFLYCLTMTSICFGVQGTLTFLPALGLEKGFTRTESAMLLSVAGFADIVGRFVNGVVFDLKPIRHRRRPVHCLVGIATGFTVVSFGLVSSFYPMMVMIVLWGLVEGGWHGQRTTIVTEVVGAHQQSSAIGISIFFQGLGNSVAPITGALLRDAFNSYAMVMYYFGSVVIVTSGLFLLDYFLSARCQERRRQRRRSVLKYGSTKK